MIIIIIIIVQNKMHGNTRGGLGLGEGVRVRGGSFVACCLQLAMQCHHYSYCSGRDSYCSGHEEVTFFVLFIVARAASMT